MIGELGHFALILALVAALFQGLAGLLPQAPARLPRAAISLQAVGLVAAFVALTVAFVQNDFTLVYVVQHSNRDLPLAYRMAGVWGGHEGSMLLWTLILVGWTVVAERSLARRDATHARHLAGVLGVVSAAMLMFVLFTSNPFIRLLPAAQEGQSLNPLLQDPGLVFHPPLLYLGYVGTVVPFAAVMARMLSPAATTAPGGGPELWVRWLRPFTLWAFLFLTLGIALGSWWAYYELGWGGWWFWDPVENASLMPWLALAALLHVLAVREQRGVMGLWTGVLSVAAFVLSLLGTFLVRSGVLTSVHAFASDPRRGSVMLALVAVTLVVGFLLLSVRVARLMPVRAVPAYHAWSREGLVSANSVLLLAACATVLLGTLYPLAMDALALGKISVGPPYFDAVMLPLMLPLLLVAAVAPWLTWAAVDASRLWRQLRATLALTLLAVVALPWGLQATHGRVSLLAVVGLVLAAGLLASTALHAWRNRRGGALVWGMALAHVGVAVFAVGVSMVNTYGVERDVQLAPGDSTPLADCSLRFDGVTPVRGVNYDSLQARFDLSCPGQAPLRLMPEKRSYPGSAMPMTESAIVWGATRDLYVAMADMVGPGPSGPWMVRLQVKPFMRWVWGGAVLMALGAGVASLARRYRLKPLKVTHD